MGGDPLQPQVEKAVLTTIAQCRDGVICDCGHPSWAHHNEGSRRCDLPMQVCPCVMLRYPAQHGRIDAYNLNLCVVLRLKHGVQ